MLASLVRRARSVRADPWERAVALDLGPAAIFLLLAWAKLALFSLPPWHHPKLAWTGFLPLAEASQALLGSLSTLMIVLAPLLLVPAVPRYLLLWGLNLVITLVVLANFVHFRYFGDVISVAAVGATSQLSLVVASVVELLRPADALFFADLVVAAVLFGRYRRAVRGGVRAPSRARWLSAAGAVGVGALLLIVPIRIVQVDPGETFKFSYFRFFGVRKIGLLNYHAYEAAQKFVRQERSGERVTPAQRERALTAVARLREEAMAPSPLWGVARGKNVILVLMESVQAFPIGLRVAGQEVTPTLNGLARRSLVFENFYSQAWEGQTSDGEFSTLHSLHPLPAGAVATTYPYNQFRGLPRILQERGYATLSAHAYYGDMWNMRQIHPKLGFQRSLFRESYRIGEEVGMSIPDGEFFRQTLPHLERLPRPFAAYLMTLTTHHPYRLPEHFRKLRLGRLEGTLLGDYLHAVHYLDTALGELVSQLQRSGLWDESVLVLFGDHRARLGDSGDLAALLRQHADLPPPAEPFDVHLWEAENRVPLLIRLPDDQAAGVYSVSGGHLDIAPTLLGLLGVGDHEMVALGRDLTQREDGFVVLRNGSFVLGDTVCVTPGAGVPTTRCADGRTGAAMDPQRFSGRLAEARDRLRLSDLILAGNLIPAR